MIEETLNGNEHIERISNQSFKCNSKYFCLFLEKFQSKESSSKTLTIELILGKTVDQFIFGL